MCTRTICVLVVRGVQIFLNIIMPHTISFMILQTLSTFLTHKVTPLKLFIQAIFKNITLTLKITIFIRIILMKIFSYWDLNMSRVIHWVFPKFIPNNRESIIRRSTLRIFRWIWRRSTIVIYVDVFYLWEILK